MDLNGTFTEITLAGPANLPTSFNDTFGQVVHTFADSFTGIIPKEWVQQGLKITVITPAESLVFDNLSVSAPNRILMTNFEINAFSLQNSSFYSGWEAEYGSKLPAAEFKVQSIPNILFPTISAPPPGGTITALKFSSLAEYNTLAGIPFNKHNDVSQEWKAALRDASGTYSGGMKYFTVSWTYTDRPQKGVGGGYSSVQRRGGANGLGTMIHEVGHALSLPHWGSATYPYKGIMYGIEPGTSFNETHAGPIWAYDDVQKKFIKPTIDGFSPLTFKSDPMEGGGQKNPEPGYYINHFSDYSVNQMRSLLEGHLVVYNETLGNYAKWNNTTKSYSTVQTNTGNVRYPIQREVDVISIMAAASSTTPQVDIVYPPIGPYKSGVIAVFDPRVAIDRTNADTYFCPTNGCDTTLKIVQGSTTKYIMLPMALDASLAATDPASFDTKAVNLLASDGEVFKVELLSTPDAEINGLPTNPIVLSTWTKTGYLSNESIGEFAQGIEIFIKNRDLKLSGFQDIENASIKIFSITGKQIFFENFTTNTENNFVIPNVARGVYILQIVKGKDKFSRKILLD
ncbi:MAG TPA: hypothetical protein DCM02_10590 [Flavobacterium sp.]|nr:hypothetical protein [Flavobacterium sp.]